MRETASVWVGREGEESDVMEGGIGVAVASMGVTGKRAVCKCDEGESGGDGGLWERVACNSNGG